MDITEQKQTHERNAYLAHHDLLTNLPNRLLFFDRVTQSLALAKRQSYPLAVLFIDLDKFKPINDSLGHEAGDEVLRLVAGRLSGCVRASDTLARVGGDEFIGLFPDVGNRDSLSFLGERLLGVFDEPFEVMGHLVSLSGSIGLVVAPADGEDQDSLLKAADEAMYRAKQAGKRRVQLSAVSPGRAA